ncbi:hypothetical protein SNEBB_005633 [Seison nebaliae]|nr:hypothetical protein SNEBB_005633 [Seison nebaliae]
MRLKKKKVYKIAKDRNGHTRKIEEIYPPSVVYECQRLHYIRTREKHIEDFYKENNELIQKNLLPIYMIIPGAIGMLASIGIIVLMTFQLKKNYFANGEGGVFVLPVFGVIGGIFLLIAGLLKKTGIVWAATAMGFLGGLACFISLILGIVAAVKPKYDVPYVETPPAMSEESKKEASAFDAPPEEQLNDDGTMRDHPPADGRDEGHEEDEDEEESIY